MILVTGTGRCGSSLMMQTLCYLGVPLIGDPENYNNVHCLWNSYQLKDDEVEAVTVKISEELDFVAREMNPKGYWELPLDDIITRCKKGFGSKDKGQAIKIIGGLVSELGTEDIEKIILCTRRNREAQAKSTLKLGQTDMQIAESSGVEGAHFSDWYREKTYIDVMSMQTTQGCMLDNLITNYGIPSIDVCFEDILENPKREIQSVVHFLELGDVDISEAVDNVDKR